MSVTHLITDLCTGGAQVALLRLLAGLDRDRFSPAVACLYDGDTAVAQEIRALGIPVTDLGFTTKWRWDAFGRLYRLLRRERPAILHTWLFHANLAGRIVGHLANVPLIVTSRRNVNIGGGLRERLNRWTARLDDRVVAVCELARKIEVKEAGVSPGKVVTIYNGVDAERFAACQAQTVCAAQAACAAHACETQAAVRVRRAFGIPVKAPLLGSVGRLHPQKGQADLLIALARVRERVPAVRLLLVGGGELRADLEAQARSLGLCEAVTFAGLRPDVPEILAALDVFVLPSLWEGMPNVVLEAMAAGLPVVATAVGGTPEAVVDGVTGLLVPPRAPVALARAVERLLRDPNLRRKMGQAGRARVDRYFSIDQTVRQTQELYETLLREKGLDRGLA